MMKVGELDIRVAEDVAVRFVASRPDTPPAVSSEHRLTQR